MLLSETEGKQLKATEREGQNSNDHSADEWNLPRQFVLPWQVLFLKTITLKYKIFYSQRSLNDYGQNSIYISGPGSTVRGNGPGFLR